MLRLRLLVTLSFITLAAYGQKSIEQYKQSIDSFMAIHLHTTVLKGLKCDSYMATLKNENSVSYAGDYGKEKEKVLINVGMIGFFFDYYCPKLNYSFHWYLNLNEDGRILPVYMISKTFPVCIQKGQPCNLITKDSAVKIAQADSMKFTDNYYVEFLSPGQSDNFYWVITGVDKKSYDYSIPPKEGRDVPIPPWRKGHTKIIDATTGKIISLQEYYRLDKD